MTPLLLQDINAIPRNILSLLDKHRNVFEAAISVESLCDEDPIRPIAVKLHQYIYSNSVLAYHCTKEPKPGFYKSHGLRTLDRVAHQREFIKQYGHIFTEEELSIIEDAWKSYFDPCQDNSRNRRIAFCFTPHLVINNGTGVFFRYFGGEAIFMPLKRHGSIMAKLERIGEPVVVVFPYQLDTSEQFTRFSVATTMLSHYHKTVRPDAMVMSKQGFRMSAVPRDEIISVMSRTEFFRRYN